MFKQRALVFVFILLFGLVGSLNTLACFLENDAPGKGAYSSPTFVSCLDNEGSPFVLRAGQWKESKSPSEVDKNVPHRNATTGSFEGMRAPAVPALASGAVYFPFSMPIYQLKTAYLI